MWRTACDPTCMHDLSADSSMQEERGKVWLFHVRL